MGKKTNWFSRVLIIILIIFIGALVICSFILGEPAFSLTNEIILLILLLIVLALSEVFDNFCIGNLIMAQKEKHEKEVELKEVKTENNELRTQLTNLISNSVSNQNMNILRFSKDDWVQLAGDEQIESKAVEEKKDEKYSVDNKSFADDTQKRHRLFRKIEKFVLDRFCIEYKIPMLSIVREVKFSNEFIGLDPIMDKNAIFDAYYKSVQEELFIEIKINLALGSMIMYNLYYLLSKVYYYKKTNKLNAKVVLIIPNLPESYWKGQVSFNAYKNIYKLQETFAPAIKNNLLKIIPIEITQNDLDKINKELEVEERERRKNQS